MDLLTTAFYFIVTLGVLVFVHELGHFLAAKMCGMRVDVFSIGFPPRAFGKKIGETDYCVSWIPIGGYVKIAGMIDESFDTDFLNKAPEPWEYRSKPIWQRMFVISAGVLMNLILAVVIFWGINYVQGRTVWNTTEVGHVAEGSPAEEGGLKSGDKILSVNAVPVTNWDEIRYHLYLENMGSDLLVTVQRGEEEAQLYFPHNSEAEPGESSFGIVPSHAQIVVNAVEPGKPAEKLGLKPLDVILALNDTPVKYDQKVKEIVQGSAGKPLRVEWKRGDEIMSGTTTPTESGLIGISFSLRYNGPITRMEYSVLEAFPEGVKNIVNVTGLTMLSLKMIITGKTPLSQSVAGPVRIAQMATQSAELGAITYLGFMAFLSISLAILNILPFPALDGGHLLFLVYEGAFRREIPVKIKMTLQRAGLVLLLAFMALAVFNDIVNF
ncbi:MAG: RIP metalloprotease RseP [Ignavibacteriae bacterium]|nr:RIP metalloprotease RseP [Ignavibacteriota bacterium]